MKLFVNERLNWLRDNPNAPLTFYRSFHDELLDNGYEPIVLVDVEGLTAYTQFSIRYDPSTISQAVLVRPNYVWNVCKSFVLQAPDLTDRVLLVTRCELQHGLTYNSLFSCDVERFTGEHFPVTLFAMIPPNEFTEEDLINSLHVMGPKMDLGAICWRCVRRFRDVFNEADYDNIQTTVEAFKRELVTGGYGDVAAFVETDSGYAPLEELQIHQLYRWHLSADPYSKFWVVETKNNDKMNLFNPFNHFNREVSYAAICS